MYAVDSQGSSHFNDILTFDSKSKRMIWFGSRVTVGQKHVKFLPRIDISVINKLSEENLVKSIHMTIISVL